MKQNKCSVKDLLALFEDSLTPADILTSKIMTQISTAITKERLKLCMSQAEFAEHINASQSLISRWERGDYNFSIRKVAEIAAALNLDVNLFFCSAPLQHQKNNITYSEANQFVTTICYSSKIPEYKMKEYTAVQASTFIKSNNEEEKIYASVC